MKLSKILFFITLFCIFAIPSFAQKKIDIFGYYFIEKPTKDFKDIYVIHLTGNYDAKEKPPFYGLIEMKAKKAKNYFLLKPKMLDKKITFSTESVKGVSYKFKGAFTKLGNFPISRPDEQIILKGKLTKLKGKRTVASKRFSFIYFAGD